MTLKIYELAKEFEGLDDRERLEVLLDFSETLPDVDGEHGPVMGVESCRIQECQTPVYMRVLLDAGETILEAEVSRKSPTVRGIVAVIVEGLSVAAPGEVLALPD